jgi:hypothetical protein
MALRVYICPVIGGGTKGNAYRGKAQEYGYECANFIPDNPATGAPKFSWALAIIRSDDFSAIEADAECDDLFGGDLPASVDTRPELRALLKTRTVADVPLARRNAIIAVLDKYAINRTDFTGQTPLWRVFQRVVSTLFGSLVFEQDSEFPAF